MTCSNSKFNITAFFCIAIFCISCGNSQQDQPLATKPAAPVAATINPNALARFDTLEYLFQNDNWLLINGTDSSYIYASRLGKTIFKSYQFRISKGDSVNTVITQIQLKGETLSWHWPQDTTLLLLTSAGAGKLIWSDTSGQHKYIFEKISSDRIRLFYPGGKTAELIKTPTLSSFLVRSKYDYLHGTKLAFAKEK